jgi:predicted alpha/beta hydrolase family esterase
MQSPIITVVYSHGRHGSPWYGFKIEALRSVALRAGVNMISVRYPEEMRVEDMEQRLFDAVKDDVAVPGDLVFLSSSRGAYLSTRVAQRVIDHYAQEATRLDDDNVLPRRHVLGQFLVAPAFYIKPDYYPDQSPTPPTDFRTTIVHGLDDNVINSENSVRFAKQFKAQLHLVSGGHRLNSQRDRLCLLFEDFLTECIAEANRLFAKWLKDNPQPTTQPDDESPLVRHR